MLYNFTLNYPSTVSPGRIGLCCPLVWVERPLHDRRPRTGRCRSHSCCLQELRCSCSCCCSPPSLRWSCGCSQCCASKPAESYWTCCIIWHQTDSRDLRQRHVNEVMHVFWLEYYFAIKGWRKTDYYDCNSFGFALLSVGISSVCIHLSWYF